jgi:DNA-binding LytR/AlgR family response regulator
MITCYIVDDENHAISVLEQYIRQTPGMFLVGSQENPLLALDAFSRKQIEAEIVFVDVDMPQLSGVDLAEMIAPHARVVFTTAHASFAVQAFEKNAVDYLLKPITYERFLKSVSKIRERRKETPMSAKGREEAGYFFVKSETKGKMERVDLADILYVEALQNYVRIHLRHKRLITYLTMKEMEEYLPPANFSRIHKSFIVHHNKVKTVEGNQVVLENDTAITLGATFREEFLASINAKLVKSRRLP